ncbi:hypothetical protein STAL104432_26150 [Streptomyces albus]
MPVVPGAEPLPEGGTPASGLLGGVGAGGQHVEEFVVVAGDGAGRRRGDVEVGAAGVPVGVPVGCVDDEGPVESGVVEHQGRVVGDQHVGGEAQLLHRRVVRHIDDTRRQTGRPVPVVEVVGADQDDEAGAEPGRQPGHVQRGPAPWPVVAVGGRVQHGDGPFGDAQPGAGAGHVGGGRRLEDVGARIPELQRRVRRRVGALPHEGRVRVGGEAVVPAVGVPQQPAEVHPGRGGRIRRQIQAHVLERGAVVRLEKDLAGAFDVPVVEVDVADEEAGAGQRRPVGGRAGPQVPHPGRHGVRVPRLAHPRGAHMRRQLPDLRLDRGRIAGVTAVPVRGEDRQVLIQPAAALEGVVGLEQGGPRPGAQHAQPGGDGGTGPVGLPQQPERAVGAAPHQQMPQPGAGAQRLPGAARCGPVPAAVCAGLPQERGAVAAREPAGAAVDDGEVVGHPPVQRGPPAGEGGAVFEEREEAVVLCEHVEVGAAGARQDAAAAPLPVVDAHPAEGGEGAGGQQHGERPGGVLVPARREGEPLAGQEVAAVRLGPGEGRQAQQLGPVGEGEDLGVRAGRQHVGVGGDGFPVPVPGRVVEQQHVGLAGGRQPVGDGAQGAGDHHVVAVEVEHVVAAGPRGAGVAGRAETAVLRQMDDGHAGVGGGVGVEDLTARVGGAVVDGYQLEVAEALAEHGVEAFAQIRLHLVDGDDHTESRHGCFPGWT